MDHRPDENRTSEDAIEVALIALVRRGVKGWEVLLTRRPHGAHLGGYWELPGGKVEKPRTRDGYLASETPRHAAVREAREELGITVDPAALVPCDITTHSYPDRVIRFHPYLLVDPDQHAIDLSRVTSLYAWAPVDELDRWQLPPANQAINRLLANRLLDC